MRKLVPVAAVALLAALAWFFMGRDSGTNGADPLDFVPADTPFVFANIEPLPTAVTERYLALSAGSIPQYRSMLARGAGALEEKGDAESLRAAQWMRAMEIELTRHPDPKSLMAAFGMSLQGKAAIYGIGLAPVVRVSLADPAQFVASIERVETAANDKLPRFEREGVSAGWKLEIPDAPIGAVAAIVGNHLVFTFVPSGESVAIDELLGLSRPKTSLAKSGALAKLNREAGFTPYGSGYIDTARLLEQFRQPATALERAFLDAMEMEKPRIPAECNDDVKAIVANFPRAIAGYTKLDVVNASSVARIETSSAIAADLKTLLAPMPGLAVADKSMASFGFSIRPGAIPTWANKIADATAKNPWTCPALVELNDGTRKLREAANNPAFYAAAPMAYSLHFVLSRLELPFGNPDDKPKFAGKILIGSDNPAGLVSMARNFLPQIASLQLAAGAPPQPVPAELVKEFSDEPVFAAQTATALGISIGEGEEADLPAFLQTDAAAPQPVLNVGYRGEFFASFGAFLRAEADKIEPSAERDEMMAVADALEQAYRQVDRVGFSIGFSDKGIELQQEMKLAR